MNKRSPGKGKDIAAALVKSTVKSGRETIVTHQVVTAMKAGDLPRSRYPLVAAYEQESTLFNERLGGWKTGTR